MVSPNAANQLLTPNSMSEIEEGAKGHQPAMIMGQMMTEPTFMWLNSWDRTACQAHCHWHRTFCLSCSALHNTVFKNIIQSRYSVVTHAFDPSTLGTEADKSLFEANLVYIGSSSLAGAT